MAPVKKNTLSLRGGKISKRRKSQIAVMVAARLAKAGNGASPAPVAPVPETPTQSAPPSDDNLRLSASKGKLAMSADDGPPASASTLTVTVVDLKAMAPLISGLLCPSCKSASLELTTDPNRRKSFATYLQIFCNTCEEVKSQGYSSLAATTDQSMEVNRKMVVAGLNVGLGYSSLMKLSEGLGVSGMHKTTYQTHVDAIFSKISPVSQTMLMAARRNVRAYFEANEPSAIDADGILQISVSFDGSWGKRGHTSNTGCTAVIEVMTGLVVDFHVMSRFCQACNTVGKRMKERDEAAFTRWQTEHSKNGCNKNYEGSSGGMEVAGALELWGPSLSYQMRYVILVGDGDTKTHLALTRLNPYGDEHPIKKEECVNHVSKRLNTALRNLISTCNKQKVRLGGNTKGSLTQAKIGMLQSYYTNAVRTYNSSVEVMSRAIWAGFHHSVSTDEEPHHDDCPSGKESWCWYQRALADGVMEPKAGSRQQSTFLNRQVADYVRPVYGRLTSPELLQQCLLGATQNANESLYSVLWGKCQKHLFAGYRKVFIAAVLAIGEFNGGSSATHHVLSSVAFPQQRPPWATRETS